jgi:hypothetical protein
MGSGNRTRAHLLLGQDRAGKHALLIPITFNTNRRGDRVELFCHVARGQLTH